MVGHNGGSTVGEVGVFGPVMVNSSLTIPEAADCGVLPGVIFLQFEAAPTIPTSMTGEMATYLFVFEREEGAMTSAQCVIEVL
jgi:hypothetical protein